MFVVLEAMFTPTAASFRKGGFHSISEISNKRRVEVFDSFPAVKAFFHRVKEHPLLEKYFKERPGDEEVMY